MIIVVCPSCGESMQVVPYGGDEDFKCVECGELFNKEKIDHECASAFYSELETAVELIKSAKLWGNVFGEQGELDLDEAIKTIQSVASKY